MFKTISWKINYPAKISASMVPGAVFIGFGTNIGSGTHRRRVLTLALLHIAKLPQTRILGVSPLLETPPWGHTNQSSFYNGVLAMTTGLPPLVLLDCLKRIERRLGRQARERWGPREIDLDILIYKGLSLKTPRLTLPHRHMYERDFVMEPLQKLVGVQGLARHNPHLGRLI